jgi:inorganic pyrophosphatase
VPTITTSVKKTTTPSEKNVTTLSSVSPASPSPLLPAIAGAASTRAAARPTSEAMSARALTLGTVPRWDSLAPVGEQDLTAIIEIPKGSRNKYEYDHELGGIKLDRFLFSSVVYPTDYGFFPDTLGLDGDPLDAMVCVSEATFPGCQIAVKAIALFRMEDDKGIDDKVLCVPLSDPGWNRLERLDDLSDQLRDEIAHFFSIYKDLEQKAVKVDGWYPREDALKEIEESRKRFREHEK